MSRTYSRNSAANAEAAHPGRITRALAFVRGWRSLASFIPLISAAVILSGTVLAKAETRVALVISNSTYVHFGTLKNPPNDAADMAAALQGRGFDVLKGDNLGLSAMQDLVSRFLAKAKSADVSLFYYAGHGFQVDGVNYLLPVDADLKSRADVPRATFELQRLLGQMQGAGIHLVFLDACRDNPFASMPNAAVTTENGLARVGSLENGMIAFATKPNRVASDGDGRNSPFAKAMLTHMNTPGEDINTMMIKVRNDVIGATGGLQYPFDETSLRSSFYFRPGPAQLPADTRLWQLFNATNDRDLIQAYLERFPSGSHATEARQYLAQATTGSEDTTTSRAVEASLGQDGHISESDVWDLAASSRLPAVIRFYLRHFPNGANVPRAQRLMESVTTQESSASRDSPGVLCDRAATHPNDATADVDGVPYEVLRDHAEAAIEVCRRAVEANPQMPHYKALLARALSVSSSQQDREESISLYKEAAQAGDLRAMHSLALLMESGGSLVKRDVPAAMNLYERAAEAGSSDAAINLAVALIRGAGISKNVPRGIELLKTAAEAGSGRAAYNLGVMADACGASSDPKRKGTQVAANCAGLKASAAADLFAQAIRFGFRDGYVAIAKLLDEGRSGASKDAARSADMLLEAISQDSGDGLNELAGKNASQWSKATLSQVQARLQKAGYYDGPIDGRPNRTMVAGLRKWRDLGH